jgi:hypothetical protein
MFGTDNVETETKIDENCTLGLSVYGNSDHLAGIDQTRVLEVVDRSERLPAHTVTLLDDR